jgi:arylsulfatase A-like enzyme/Tfp pilus assembly protein PilF
VIIVSIDTLRSDHLPAYGYGGVETPAIDRLRADGILYERAYTPVPLTLPAHTSLLSGLLTPAHGVRDNVGYSVDPTRSPMLQQQLADAGFATGAAVSAWVLRAQTGIDAGFDLYEDEIAYVGGQGLQAVQRAGPATLEAVMPWLENVASGPFFLLLHLFEPHTPYEPPEPYRSRYDVPYDGEIAAADAVVGTLIEELHRLGAYDRALIVFLSDHGEGLGEHGEAEHGLFLYRSTLQVPLILKLPGSERAGSSVERPVSLVDVAPTVLAALGLPVSESLTGRSLLGPEQERGASERPIFAETVYPRLHYGWSDLASVIAGSYQYIGAPDPELYDLEADPDQRSDLSETESARGVELAQALAQWERLLEGPGSIGVEERARLQALGYMAGGAEAGDGPLPDPKDRVGVLAELRAAHSELVHGDPEAAARGFASVLEREPRVEDAWLFLVQAQRRMGALDSAAATLSRALEAVPGSQMLELETAVVLLALGDVERARQRAASAVAYDPSTAHTLLAQIALRTGDLREAEQEAQAAVAADPSRPGPWVVLAEALSAAGRHDEAVDELVRAGLSSVRSPSGRAQLARELVRRDSPGRAEQIVAGLESSTDPDVLSAVARVAAVRGNADAAREALLRALELDPDYGRARVELGLLAMVRGDREDARQLLEAGLEDAPGIADGWNALGAVRAEAGEHAAAIEAWERALELEPQLAQVHYNLAMVRARAGQFRQAAEHMEQFAASVEGADRERALELLAELRRHAQGAGTN